VKGEGERVVDPDVGENREQYPQQNNERNKSLYL